MAVIDLLKPTSGTWRVVGTRWLLYMLAVLPGMLALSRHLDDALVSRKLVGERPIFGLAVQAQGLTNFFQGLGRVDPGIERHRLPRLKIDFSTRIRLGIAQEFHDGFRINGFEEGFFTFLN